MKKLFHWVWSFLEVVIIIYVIIITSFILCRNKYGYTQFGDYTFDNINLIEEKNIKDVTKGDLLIVKNSNDIEVGNLIYYYAAFNERYIIRSDVVTNISSDDYSSLYTLAGDGEPVTVAGTRVLGKYSNTYAKIGGILDVLESRIGFLFLVLLPIMVVFIYQVYEFIVIIHYENVEEDDEDDKNDKSNQKKSVTVEKEEQKKTEKESTVEEVREEEHQESKSEKSVEKEEQKKTEKESTVEEAQEEEHQESKSEKSVEKEEKFKISDTAVDDIEIL